MIILSDFEPPVNPLLQFENTISPIAGIWRRLAALMIDSLLLGVVGQIIALPFSSFWFEVGPYGRFVGLFFILAYFGVMNSEFGGGQTLGKRLLNIAVTGRENNAISLKRSLIRTSILEIPLIVNGWELPLFQNPIISFLLGVIIFGIGGAILYTVIFNRATRQGLHDLLCDTYVVHKAGEPIAALPQSNNIHIIISSAIVLASIVVGGIVGFASTFLTTDSPFAYLNKSYQSLQKDPRYFSASVFDSTFYSGDAKSTRTLKVNVWYKGLPSSEEFQQITNDVANIVLSDIENIDEFDFIEISVTTAYDLGIASGRFTSRDQQIPDVWRERVSATSFL